MRSCAKEACLLAWDRFLSSGAPVRVAKAGHKTGNKDALLTKSISARTRVRRGETNRVNRSKGKKIFFLFVNIILGKEQSACRGRVEGSFGRSTDCASGGERAKGWVGMRRWDGCGRGVAGGSLRCGLRTLMAALWPFLHLYAHHTYNSTKAGHQTMSRNATGLSG